ncbi:xanthine dehydrogenase family protein molybdopterin-binding subunit [Streptomyces mirabilis]|uniref:xanthine dehydrogenase family protein molybdopterin-binding subunit n=1 Tax=Streptomyces mirabilis TaxID=68239 RepID=UPI0033E37088
MEEKRTSPRRLAGDRYVSGAVRYLDDEIPQGCLHMAFARSRHAHALIRAISCERAQQVPGVRMVLTPDQIARDLPPMLALAGDRALPLEILPTRHLRYWGEPVVLIVADTEDSARFAANMVTIDCEPLTPMLDIASAVAEGATPQHPQVPGNVLTFGRVSDGDVAGALAEARQVVHGTVRVGRSSAVPLEPRGCIARWDAQERRLVVRTATQMPHAVRAELSYLLSLPEADIQVVAPPLGGAFGFKFPGMPEETLAAYAAYRLRQPVRWVETRAEALLVGAREYDAAYQVGFASDGRVNALRVTLDANIGAVTASPGPAMPAVAASAFPGPYDIPNVEVRWRAVMTNKGPWNGARGFGKELTCLVLENVMDAVASRLGLDPVDVRHRNLLRPEQLPHQTAMMTIDSGDYPRALDIVLDRSDYHCLRAAARTNQVDKAVRTGVGVAIELTPEGQDLALTAARGYETSTVRLDTSGFVTVLTGVTSPGTGSETAIAQLVADELTLPVERVRVVQGDTDRTPFGSGSFSSRAVITGGTAAMLAARDLRHRLAAAAAPLLSAEPEQVELRAGRFHVVGSADRGPSIASAIRRLRSLGGHLPGLAVPELEATRTYGPDNLYPLPDKTGRVQHYPTYSYSVHVATVNVDTETGIVKLTGLHSLHDCGTVINQALVDAQLHGANCMGVGLALFEEETYTPEGQPLALSFKHYLLPRAPDLPQFHVDHLVTPSPYTELGTKGAGESGVGGAAAAVAAAVRDALAETESSELVLPLTPERVLARVGRRSATHGEDQ